MKTKLLFYVVLLTSFAWWNSVSAHSGKWADSHSGNDTATNEPRWHANAWETNGCSGVMDSQRGVFHFEHACDHHDGCYRQTWGWRISCDDDFYKNMEVSCKHNWAWWNPARTACRGVKEVYYTGVRTFGWPYYNRKSIWTSW